MNVYLIVSGTFFANTRHNIRLKKLKIFFFGFIKFKGQSMIFQKDITIWSFVLLFLMLTKLVQLNTYT